MDYVKELKARARREKKKKEEAKQLKWITVTIGIDPELLKELRWIVRRDRACGDRVTLKTLIVEGLYKVIETEHEVGEIIGEFRKTNPPPKPQKPSRVQ